MKYVVLPITALILSAPSFSAEGAQKPIGAPCKGRDIWRVKVPHATRGATHALANIARVPATDARDAYGANRVS
jgi:hypothetical protein